MIAVFLTLIWKNYKKQNRHTVIFLMSIFVPLFAAVVPLVSPYSRNTDTEYNPTKVDDKSVDFKWNSLVQKINVRRERMLGAQMNFKANVFIPQIVVAYANSSHLGLQKLMESALGNLGINKSQIYGFENCDAMRTKAAFEHFIASVCFHNTDGDESKNGLPHVLHFSIIMPAEVRNYEHTWMGQTWKHSGPPVLYHLLRNTAEIVDDGATEYLQEGFLPLQYYISTEYVRMASMVPKMPPARLRAMTASEDAKTKFSESAVTTAKLIMVLGYMFPVIILVKLMVEEHELGQCFVLQVNNAGKCLQVTAWFFNASIQLLVTSVFLGLLIMYTSTTTPSSLLFYTLPFLASYSISVASLIIFLSAIIRSTKLALVMVPILWFLLPFPFLFTEQLKFEVPYILYLVATFLMCNVTLSQGLNQLLIYCEPFGTADDDTFLRLDFPYLIGIFLAQAVVFCVLVPIIQMDAWVYVTRYVMSIPGRCKACCRRWKRRRRQQKEKLILHDEEEMLPTETSLDINPLDDIKPLNDIKPFIGVHLRFGSLKGTFGKHRKNINNIRTAGLEFRRVYKKFSRTNVVIHRFSLSVFPGEVVVLLGHNASGKSTIMRMIRGLILPTHGQIFISGVNMVRNNVYFNRKTHRRVGISLTTTSLFTEFTVFDHLVFFGRLRGLKKSEARAEVKTYMRLMHMEAVQRIRVGKLSIGQKRIVQSICAFVGRTKIVILHKPLDGVDESTAKQFFDFVQREKMSRSIFVTTNRSKVASSLGDRIGILVEGRLLFLGTERQLGQDFNDVFRLTIYGNPNCNFEIIRTFLEDFTRSGVEVESKMGDLAVYLINRRDFTGMVSLLEDLPRYMLDLQIEGYKIQECSLDQILINWFTPEPFDFAIQDLEPDHLRRRAKFESLKRFLRRFSHFMIAMRHRGLIDLYNAYFLIIKLLLPVFVTLWLGLCIIYHPTNKPWKGIRTFPIAYRARSGITLAQKALPMDDNGPMKAAYDKFLTTGAKEVDRDLDITDMGQMRHAYGTDEDGKILATVKFMADGVEATYNNKWGQTAPQSLALVMNSLAVGFVGPDSGIKAEMETLPFSTIHPLNQYNVPLLSITVLCFSFCLIWTMPMLYMNLSQNQRFNYIELIAGMRLSVLASAILLYETLVLAFSFITLHLVILLLALDTVMFAEFFWFYGHSVLMVGLCVLSLDLLVSLKSTVTQNAYLLVLTFHTVGILSYMFVREFSPATEKYVAIAMDFYPLFSLMEHVITLAKFMETKWLCHDNQIYETSVHVDKCTSKPNCCIDPLQDYYHWRYVACNYAFVLIVWGLIYLRMRASLPKTSPKHGRFYWDSDADGHENQSLLHFGKPTDLQLTVLDEKSRVRTLERSLIYTRSLHVGHLSVLFDQFLALNKISFMIDRHQVLSLYGPNGSGKTVLTKAILGFYAANTGRVSSPSRMPYLRETPQIGNLAGYSAQEVLLMQELTILDVLSLVLRIRHWLKAEQLKEQARTICKILNLYDYRHNILLKCSQGVLKRLSIALALMTNAELVLLDDPFANLDVIAQHTVIQSIQDACDHGLCVMYTCADTDFATPAQRLAAISHSTLIAIGERNELTQKYYASYYIVETKIYLLEIEVMIAKEVEENGMDQQESMSESLETRIFLSISGFVKRIFPRAIINPKTVIYPRTSFWLSSKFFTVSQIFQKLHRYQDNFYSFTIGQPSVGALFLQIKPEQAEN